MEMISSGAEVEQKETLAQ
ncbi:uncharacterized, partial [Tachysurus ichikawai]